MKQNDRNQRSLPGTSTQTVGALIMLVLLVFVSVAAFMQRYNDYNENVLYAERLNQMQEVTVQLFSGLEDVVNSQWKSARFQCNFLKSSAPGTVAGLRTVMKQQADLTRMGEDSTRVVAIDSQGRYYDQDGILGLMNDMSYLDGRPEQLSYVFNEMTTSRTEMLFLYRLDEPLTLQDGAQTTEIIYYGIARDMTELNPYFNCEAYNGDNSIYVVDEQGLKLFSGNNSALLPGFNTYTVLRRMQYLHGTSFDETLKSLQANGLAYSNAILDGEEYYYALYRMDNAAWTLLFLVPSRDVAINTVQLVDTTTKMMLVFAIAMTLLCAGATTLVLQIQQKRSLRVVENANAALEANNAQLEKAQAVTKEALQAAQTASKAKTEFLSSMSHDIRTPMNAILGLTTLMKNEPNLSAKMQDYLAKLESSGHHLLELINNVLDMNRIESGQTTLHPVNIDLAEQVKQVEVLVRPQASAKGQRLTIITTNLRHEHVVADPTRLQQVLVNLLSNAVKYTPACGHILLDVEELPRDEHYAQYKFIVQDDGIGMTEEFQQRIFDPFTRAENSTTNKVQGSGLGMAITKSVVDLMGGVIHLESAPGKGSRFEVTLEFPIDTTAEANVEHLSILLVQCSADNCRRVEDATLGKPIHLQILSQVASALQHLKAASYDVILMPWNLPAEDAARLREQAGRNTILLGGVLPGAEETVGESVDGILPYPFFLSNLEAEVSRVRQARRTAEQQDTSPLHGMHFLCAEDNEINAEILEMLLETKGASCTVCPDGQAIVEKFRTVKPGEYDMILMDVQMPRMNGLDAARAIRSGENPLGKTIPILAMTANAFLEDVQKSREAGMDEHLSKPVDIKVLEQTVRRLRATPPRKNNRR